MENQSYNALLDKVNKEGINMHIKDNDLVQEIKSLFDGTICIMDEDFPTFLTTEKHIPNRVVSELIWVLKEERNIFSLRNECHFWNKIAYDYYKSIGGELNYIGFLQNLGKDILASERILTNYNYGDVCSISDQNGKTEKVLKFQELVKDIRENSEFRQHRNFCYELEGTALKMKFDTYVDFRDNSLSLFLELGAIDIFWKGRQVILGYILLHKILCELTGLKRGKLSFHATNAYFKVSDEKTIFYRLNSPSIQKFTSLKINSSNWQGNIENIKIEDFTFE